MIIKKILLTYFFVLLMGCASLDKIAHNPIIKDINLNNQDINIKLTNKYTLIKDLVVLSMGLF